MKHFSVSCRTLLCALTIAAQAAWAAAPLKLTNIKIVAVPFGQGVGNAAINDNGDIIGTSFSPGPQAGFVIPRNEAPIAINGPDAVSTYLNGVNDLRTLVGYYLDAAYGFHPFTYEFGTFQTVTSVDKYTFVTGINTAGDLTGYSSNVGDTATGFLIKSGKVTSFSVPGYLLNTFPTAINSFDQIVGYYNGGLAGFLRQPDGTIKTLPFSASAINDAGVIVGTGPGPTDNSVGMAMIGNKEFTYTYPGSFSTYLTGINNRNVVVGFYLDSSFVTHIFTAQIVGE